MWGVFGVGAPHGATWRLGPHGPTAHAAARCSVRIPSALRKSEAAARNPAETCRQHSAAFRRLLTAARCLCSSCVLRAGAEGAGGAGPKKKKRRRGKKGLSACAPATLPLQAVACPAVGTGKRRCPNSRNETENCPDRPKPPPKTLNPPNHVWPAVGGS